MFFFWGVFWVWVCVSLFCFSGDHYPLNLEVFSWVLTSLCTVPDSVVGDGAARIQIGHGQTAALAASAVSLCFNFKAHGRGRRDFILKYSQILRCTVGLQWRFPYLSLLKGRNGKNSAGHSNPRSENSGFIVAGDILLIGFLGRRMPKVPIHAWQTFFLLFVFPLFFSFFPALYTALPCSCPPPLPSWACPCSPACCVGFPPLCHSCVRWQQQSKIDWNADLRSTLAHSALEIRILVHYTRLLAEQSAVTGKHNARARGSDSEF